MELCDNCGNAFEKEQEFREHIRKQHSVACEDLDLCDKQINQESMIDFIDNQHIAMNREGERRM